MLLDTVENALLVPFTVAYEQRALREIRRLALDPSDPNLNYRVFIRFVPIASLRLVSPLAFIMQAVKKAPLECWDS